MNEAEQKTEAQLHAEKYPLCTRWNNHFKEAMTVINFLGWLTNGDPSDFVEEGHGFCVAGYGRHKGLEEIPNSGEHQLNPVSVSNENLAYAYLGIDKQAIELERRAMLAELGV